MKILYVNCADIEGGAAKAATRLLSGVDSHGIDARLLVQRKSGNDPLIDGPRSLTGKAFGFVRPTIEQMMFGITPEKMNGPFCAAFLPDGLIAKAEEMAPDLIHLHWVARMMRLETLRRLTIPIVWTLHDSWAFTGGCYLPGDCTRFQESCGSCPILGSARENDLSHIIWQRKRQAWHDLNLTIIAPSRWMATRAKASSLFCNKRVEVIPNGIDITTYKPSDKNSARDFFSLPQDKKLVLFGARGVTSDRNKGFHLFAEAIDKLAADPGIDMIELVIFGSEPPHPPQNLGFRTHYLGLQHDDTSLARLYSAADVFVLPSIQENLPYTAMEAMACGTPSVAFNQGGVPDLIDHEQNGFLARPYEPDDLARGIAWVLEDDERRESLSNNARYKVEREFSVEMIAARHVELYREILGEEGFLCS
jgi:glycosyltransferase involved in cell wall biosynthesis